MSIVAIVGSRHWTDYDTFRREVWAALDLKRVQQIVSGGARGVDTMAERFAKDYRIPFVKFSTDDESGAFTQRAHARNQKIADAADELIAFPGPESKGTHDTIERFRARPARHGEQKHLTTIRAPR